MKNDSNIYDIDGDLIRDAANIDKLTIQEAREKLKKYEERLQKIVNEKGEEHRIGVYHAYIVNLQRYIINYYINHPDEIPRTNTTQEQIQKAMDELKESVEEEKPIVMDEYTDFEEIPNEDEHNG